jgi:hypothetical protein
MVFHTDILKEGGLGSSQWVVCTRRTHCKKTWLGQGLRNQTLRGMLFEGKSQDP